MHARAHTYTNTRTHAHTQTHTIIQTWQCMTYMYCNNIMMLSWKSHLCWKALFVPRWSRSWHRQATIRARLSRSPRWRSRPHVWNRRFVYRTSFNSETVFSCALTYSYYYYYYYHYYWFKYCTYGNERIHELADVEGVAPVVVGDLTVILPYR